MILIIITAWSKHHVQWNNNKIYSINWMTFYFFFCCDFLSFVRKKCMMFNWHLLMKWCDSCFFKLKTNTQNSLEAVGDSAKSKEWTAPRLWRTEQIAVIHGNIVMLLCWFWFDYHVLTSLCLHFHQTRSLKNLKPRFFNSFALTKT